MADNYMPDEVAGICLPAPASDAPDELRPMFALKLAREAERRAAEARRNLSGRDRAAPWLDWLLETFAGMEPFQRARAFDPTPAPLDVSLDADYEDPRPQTARAVACVRYFVGLPGGAPVKALPLPAGDGVRGETFYLPHLRLVLRSDAGAVAVLETDANTQLTWTDGFTLTVPRSRLVDLGRCDNPRFWAVPEVEGFPVLNYAPEVAGAVADLQLCDARELPAAMAKTSDGLRLLRQVWPSAYAAARRQLKGLVLLEERGYTRSHSPLGLLGVVVMTAVDEIRVGDLFVHEASHIRLNLMRQFDPLWKDREPEKLHESPWRQDPRPLSGIVLGVHAFLNVAQYYRRVAEWRGGDEHAEMLFERQREKVRSAWERAKAFAEPTPLGEKFFTELDREVLNL